MKQQTKAVFVIGVFFFVVVVFLDFFLTGIPALDWMALGVAFVFFAALILDSVARLVPRSAPELSHGPEKSSDELERLERIVDRAIVQGNSESLEILRERIRSIVARMVTYRRGLTLGELVEGAESDSMSLLEFVKDQDVRGILQDDRFASNSLRRDIEVLLEKIESGSI